MMIPRSALLPAILALALSASASSAERSFALGDTLTLIQRPLLNIPAIVAPGETLQVQCQAGPGAGSWEVALRYESHEIVPPVLSAVYDASTLWWTLEVEVPTPPVYELYDLFVSTQDGGLIEDVSANAVKILPERLNDWYFIHVTDPHLPDHRYSSDGASPEDSTEMVDLREVIKDINFLNPEFVVLTGDLVNEGELEDYMGWREYSRAQRLLTELEVPVYLSSGNHDIGGWNSTPPSDGTARRNWWRFFGWPRLDNPPPGAPDRSQDYSFDYGPIHFSVLEAYDNYDDWRWQYYGYNSFTDQQMAWLTDDLAATDRNSKVLLHHYDFDNQLNLTALGLDMALWGHIHHDDGNINVHPYDLATAATLDGDRAYRVIRVSGDVLSPQATLHAGATGDNVLVSFTPGNDGSEYTVAALVSNLQPIPFEHCLLKFVMPADASNPQLSDGTITQVDPRDGVKIFYVEVSMPAGNWRTVTLQTDQASGAPGHPLPFAALLPNYPNPFNPHTEIRFALAERTAIRLSVQDVSGREVAVLAEGDREAGDHRIEFEGRDAAGRELPSGLYIARLKTSGGISVRKMLLLR